MNWNLVWREVGVVEDTPCGGDVSWGGNCRSKCREAERAGRLFKQQPVFSKKGW